MYVCMCVCVCVYVCIPPLLPRFQVIEIEALSIRKNFDYQSGIDVEEKNPVFTGEEFESK